MALCQARRDTDGDGAIAVHTGHHGDMYGDAMELFLVLGGGPGTAIDALVGTSTDDRWVAIVRDRKLELVDVVSGEARPMRDADVESDDRAGARHRAAAFGDGQLLYIRHRASSDVLVVHRLADHVERELPIPDRVWRIVEAQPLAHVFTIPRDQPFPRLRTTLAAGECVGAFHSYSNHGQQGPAPTERWIDLARGSEVPAPPAATKPPDDPAPRHRPELAGEDRGPARWVP
jgi:hypothetical protein